MAPSHGPAARVLSPLSSRQSLSCCLSRVAKRSTPKPRGPLYSPSEPHGPLFTSPKLPDPGPLPFPSELHGPLFTSEPHGPLSIYLLQSLVVLPFTSEPRGLFFSPKTLWSSLSFYLLQNLMVLSFPLRTSWFSPIYLLQTSWFSPIYLLQTSWFSPFT